MHFKTELIQAGVAPLTPIPGREASYRVNRIHIPLDGRAKYRDINGVKILESGFMYLFSATRVTATYTWILYTLLRFSAGK